MGPDVCLSLTLSVCISTQAISNLFLLIFSPQGHFFNLNLSVCLFAVKFVDCGRGLVRFECSNPSDFRIEAGGIVYAARNVAPHLALTASPLLIKASDTKQEWVTQVWITPSTRPGQQVNTLHALPCNSWSQTALGSIVEGSWLVWGFTE